MENFEQFKTTKLIVRKYLADFPHLRDSDDKLVASFWKDEIGADAVMSMTAYQLLKKLSLQELTPAGSITRARRKLQEEDVTLRGETYKVRKKEEEVFKKNINTCSDEVSPAELYECKTEPVNLNGL